MKNLLKISGIALLAIALAGAGYVAATLEADRPVDTLKARWATPPSQFIDVGGLQVHLHALRGAPQAAGPAPPHDRTERPAHAPATATADPAADPQQ